MFEDLDAATEEAVKVEEKTSWWIGRWAHVITIPVWFVLFVAFDGSRWDAYISVAGTYTVFVFCLALGNSFSDSDDLFGNSRALGYIPKLLIPHLFVLALVIGGVFEWFHLAPLLPNWMTEEGRKGSLWYWCGALPLGDGGYWQGFWMARRLKRLTGESQD